MVRRYRDGTFRRAAAGCGCSDTMAHVTYSYDAPVSQSLFDRAAAVTPGGVNSPVRAFRAV
ncbi:MAG: hypothetical protein ACRDP3_12355, partial [Streptomyces sp.]